MSPRSRKIARMLALSLALVAAAAWAEREFRVYRSFEAQADESPLPADWNRPAGFVVGRLMYPSGMGGFRGFRGFGGDWRQGGTSWAVDYPRGDRYYAKLLRRLTTIDVRSVEQPVNLEDGDDVFDWPYLMVGLAGYWDLDDDMVAKLREYLLRGGFLFVDSFYGDSQWEGFSEGMRRIFPDRSIVDLPDDHEIFHVVYDLDGKRAVPHFEEFSGRAGFLSGGSTPHWRGVLDDQGRVMVAIAFNSDVSDSFQWSDNPDYPADGASLGLRIGVNFAVYALSH
ncbi:MAG: DUF4159 domain-containing protein [Proteobacteria bacterium]|nr:DUF4159 domain-containing protein [Pseudomonadota bacterium]MBK7117148.1 DUF4159 domain-containing protein [Pseudomonadota bacterium]MBK9252085.1 DUF4159 domain-containing protein [Pseudomonadota bacterium]MCC6633768.1 DUF4159 domain-containing protein [Gammaproteobacteria bacterium]